jgi:hypothetical protein
LLVLLLALLGQLLLPLLPPPRVHRLGVAVGMELASGATTCTGAAAISTAESTAA